MCWPPARPIRCASSSNWPSAEIGRTVEWRGTGTDEEGLDAETGEVLVEIDPRYFRPTEVHTLLGDATRPARHSAGPIPPPSPSW